MVRKTDSFCRHSCTPFQPLGSKEQQGFPIPSNADMCYVGSWPEELAYPQWKLYQWPPTTRLFINQVARGKPSYLCSTWGLDGHHLWQDHVHEVHESWEGKALQEWDHQTTHFWRCRTSRDGDIANDSISNHIPGGSKSSVQVQMAAADFEYFVRWDWFHACKAEFICATTVRCFLMMLNTILYWSSRVSGTVFNGRTGHLMFGWFWGWVFPHVLLT